MGWLEKLSDGFIFIFWTLGWPMIVGSLVWAIPLTALTYPFITIGMLKYRNFIAQREGMTYQDWKEKNVRVD